MPTSALLTATAERSINFLLAQSKPAQAGLKSLAGSRLTVYLQELPIGLCLAFSAEKVDVLAVHENFVDYTKALEPRHCVLNTQLSALGELQDSSRLTKLIQNRQLELAGDIDIAQGASQWLHTLKWDWEEWLAGNLGDELAYYLGSAHRKIVSGLQGLGDKLAGATKNTLLEERPLAAHKLAVMHFCDQVSDLSNDTARLEARLEHLLSDQHKKQ